MSRLIKSNFFNIFKSRYFYVLMVITVVIGAFFTIGIYYSPEISVPENTDLDLSNMDTLALVPNFAGIILPFISAASVGMFLETEYTQGTIRNKIICGNERSKIFFSQLITVCLLTLLYFVLFEATVFGISVIAFDFSDISLKALASSLGALFIMIIASSTVLSFVIGSLVHGGKLIVLLLGIQYAMNVFLVFGLYKENSRIFDYLSRIAPQGMMFTMTYNAVPDKLMLNIMLSLILITVLVFTGFSGFRKSDIT